MPSKCGVLHVDADEQRTVRVRVRVRVRLGLWLGLELRLEMTRVDSGTRLAVLKVDKCLDSFD